MNHRDILSLSTFRLPLRLPHLLRHHDRPLRRRRPHLADFSAGGELHFRLETSSQWFLFVAAMCTFRQNFLVHLQLGATRKTLVKGWICAALVIDALLVLINLIILSIFLLIGLPVASTLFNWGLDPIPLRLFANSVQMYCANLLLMSIGYLLTCGFYRLNKIGKWLSPS